MKNLNLYESFEDEETKEILEDFINEIWPDISRHLKSLFGLDTGFSILDEDSFMIEYWPSSMDGSIPNRISYIVDDLKTIIEKEMNMGISWRFGPNGNCQQIIFNLDSPIQKGSIQDKILKVKKALKFT